MTTHAGGGTPPLPTPSAPGAVTAAAAGGPAKLRAGVAAAAAAVPGKPAPARVACGAVAAAGNGPPPTRAGGGVLEALHRPPTAVPDTDPFPALGGGPGGGGRWGDRGPPLLIDLTPATMTTSS